MPLDLNRSVWDPTESADESEAAANDNAEVRPPRLPTLADSFLEQWGYITSTALFNAVCCSRRAGKTNGAIPRAILVLARPGTWVHYVNLIRRNARKQFWRPLLAYLKRLGWEEGVHYQANETEMIISTAWGSFLQAMSCDSTAGTKAVQGDRSDLFIVDECHLPNDDVLQLLVDVATPMLTDTGGMLDLLGLPPEVEPCFFSRALDSLDEDGKPIEGEGFKVFSWDQFAHDFPRSRELKWQSVKAAVAKRGFKLEVTEATNDNGRLVLKVGPGTHPIVARQYFGLRVRDPSKVAYEYTPGFNDYDPATINLARGSWRLVWGFDIGYSDHDALVVGATDDSDPEQRIYVLWSWHHRHLDVFHDADLMAAVEVVLPPNRTIGDDGGHGAVKTLKGLGRRLGKSIQPKPRDVMVSLGLTNDELRARRLLLPIRDVWTAKILDAARQLYAAEPERLELVEGMLTNRPTKDVPDNKPLDLRAELQRVQKSVNQRTKKVEINKRGLHSDGSEAFRYMVSGFVRGPADPDQPEVTDPDELNLRRVQEFEERWRQQQTGRRWA